jgi:hypothetical protein
MCILRKQIVTVCTVNSSKLIPPACAVYAYKKQNISPLLPACAVYTNKLLPHEHGTLAIGYRMRSVH